MLVIGYSLIITLFALVAIVCSLYISSPAPAIVILIPMFILTGLTWIVQKDMNRAYVEISGDTITVVDYYFGIRKEKAFQTLDISGAEIVIGYSMRVRGYRYSNGGCTYLVFRDHSGHYLFKVMCVPETKQFFDHYLRQS